MIEEHRRVYRISAVIVLAMACIAMPFDRTVSASLLLGLAFYYVYLLVLTKTVTVQLEAATSGRPAPALPALFLLRMAVLAAPLFIAAKLPEHLNILAAFAPLFINHIATFVVYGRKGAVSA